jgi:hypothetical protein
VFRSKQYYAVSFNGVWLNAEAVVKAYDIDEARKVFWANIPDYLYEKNAGKNVNITRIYEDFTMLWDGDY